MKRCLVLALVLRVAVSAHASGSWAGEFILDFTDPNSVCENELIWSPQDKVKQTDKGLLFSSQSLNAYIDFELMTKPYAIGLSLASDLRCSCGCGSDPCGRGDALRPYDIESIILSVICPLLAGPDTLGVVACPSESPHGPTGRKRGGKTSVSSSASGSSEGTKGIHRLSLPIHENGCPVAIGRRGNGRMDTEQRAGFFRQAHPLHWVYPVPLRGLDAGQSAACRDENRL